VFGDAGRTAGVPLAGDDLARALGNGTGAGESPAAARREQVETPASAWRRNDRAVAQPLAALELGALGLRAPHPPPDGGTAAAVSPPP
jgi:hypothetical protein